MLKAFLQQNEQWLKTTLKEQQSLRSKYPPKKYIQSEDFLFCGHIVNLNFSPTTAKKPSVALHGDNLVVFIPQTDWEQDYLGRPHPEVKVFIQKYYKTQGKKCLSALVKKNSEQMGLTASGLSFRAQKTRWGSCSPSGKISLNWKLILAPLEVQEYVVIHELAHLKHPDHSSQFWDFVQHYCPDYKNHKKWLREHQFEFDFLSQISELHS